ncbi:unnamed protein product [Nippostrongylus brasiliensis]|uniref:Intraflagellar transport protein che-13 (inferred by orthology to a C. elegans protein) n=1 Tax=Nippostrongylus brasiliensis TaxID=27835 RepID=A0A158QZ00_NIPBR|nr:unnamed protein product [Nippostrongylus brasiliensis]
MDENGEEKEQELDLPEGPGKLYEPYLKNEDLVDKLKLLNYEDGFLGMNAAFKPIHRYYFVDSTNVGEQFFMFTSLAAWLIRTNGEQSYDMPQEDVAVDFPANRLKSGAGEAVLYVLDALADMALVHINFRWEKCIEDDAYIDEDDGVFIDLSAPLSNEHQDWRMHLEQMSSLHKTMCELINEVTPKLEETAEDVEKSLERIETRERTLNQQLGMFLLRYKEAQDARAEAREKYKAASVGVTERTTTLQRISEDIDQLKMQIEEQGAKTTDGAPMVKVKQAIVKIEADIQRMNVQIGVLEQNLLLAQLKDRVSFTAEGYGLV